MRVLSIFFYSCSIFRKFVPMKKIIVASDSFKGSLSSAEVASFLKQGFAERCPGCEVIGVEVADGGEGTVQAIASIKKAGWVTVQAQDPIGRMIPARFAVLEGGTALLEMSEASGLPLLSIEERNPLATSTFGTGELIAAALDKGCRNFVVGLGGSATNDAGTGMLAALGARFLDKNGQSLKGCGQNLEEIESIDLSGFDPRIGECHFDIACDVDNPFCGPRGAAFVFAPQKGADPQTVARLDKGLEHFAGIIFRDLKKDISTVPGAGAAGGLGGAFLAFFDAQLKTGVNVVLDSIDFDHIIEGADLVITGEGKMDFQTASGKTPLGVLRKAQKQGIPVVAVAGLVKHCETLDNMGFRKIYATAQPGIPFETLISKEYTGARLKQIAAQILQEYQA